jgi:hydrogenase maturation protease
LLDWLDGIDTLIICDALVCDWPPGTWRSWTWPAPQIEVAHFSGSHDLSLPAVLALADRLSRLPARVEIWAVSIDPAQSPDGVSAAIAAAVPQIAREVRGALCHA